MCTFLDRSYATVEIRWCAGHPERCPPRTAQSACPGRSSNGASVLGRVLHEHGYEPVNASSVDEAVRLLSTTAVTAIILDTKLSRGHSGLELLERIRQQPGHKSTPAVVMTGAALTEEER